MEVSAVFSNKVQGDVKEIRGEVSAVFSIEDMSCGTEEATRVRLSKVSAVFVEGCAWLGEVSAVIFEENATASARSEVRNKGGSTRAIKGGVRGYFRRMCVV